MNDFAIKIVDSYLTKSFTTNQWFTKDEPKSIKKLF